MRVTRIVGLITIAVLTGSIALAQDAPAGGQGVGRRGGGAPPAPPKNLQVLPKDMTTPQVFGVMRVMSAGLGVNCGYCHVWEQGGQNNDMAADTKAPKLVARVMMQLTNDINAKLASAIQKPDRVSVECATCHRGQAIPVNPPPPAPPQRGGGGAPAPAAAP